MFGSVIQKAFVISRFINSTIFGRTNLLLTNSLISASMGTCGDIIQQHYDIIANKIKNEKNSEFNYVRNIHMTACGFTTGLVSHYWYILLDRYLGTKRCLSLVIKKVLLDQILFSPINLAVYFITVGICERSSIKRIKNEIKEKGMENIYIVEWFIWPPAQFFNFYVLPLRYRLLFDNIISLGFDIYSPYVKYKIELREKRN